MSDTIAPRHDWLAANRSYFELAELSYRGGKAYIDAYLIKHPRESQNTFETRKKNTFYTNYVEKTVNILTSFVMKNVVRQFDSEGGNVGKYLDSVDYYQTLDEFVEKKMVEYLLHGNAYTIADSDNKDRAYLIDANYLDLGDVREKPDGTAGVDIQRGDKVFRYEDGAVSVADLKEYNGKSEKFKEIHRYADGIIPIVAVNRRLLYTKPYFADAVYINRNIFNLHSNLGKQLTDTGFLILALPSASNKTVTDATAYIRYNPAAPALPHFVAPPLDHLDFFLRYIVSLVDSILATLNIYREDNSKQESGVAKSYDYSIMSAFLAKLARKFEAFERSCWDMLAKFDKTLDRDKITVEYKQDFDLRTLSEEIENAIRLMSLNISPGFNRELEKKIAARYIDNEKTLKEVLDEIEKKDYLPAAIDDHTHIGEGGNDEG